MITEERLVALEELEKKATPAPWNYIPDSADGKDEAYCEWHRIGPLELTGKELDEESELLVELRNSAPDLLATVRAYLELREVAENIAIGCVSFRDSVLNFRGHLEEGTINGDQANAVLREFDNEMHDRLTAYEALTKKDKTDEQ